MVEEVAGLKLFDSQAFSRLHAWANNLKEVPMIKENLPDRDKVVALMSAMVKN